MPVEDIEWQFWNIVTTPDRPLEVLYGSDLDTLQYGSGFPQPPPPKAAAAAATAPAAAAPRTSKMGTGEAPPGSPPKSPGSASGSPPKSPGSRPIST